MEKRGVTILISMVCTLILVCNLISATDIAYVLKNPNRPDTGFLEAFNSMSLSVDLIKDKDIPTTDFSKYKAVFIGDEKLKNIKKIPTTTKNCF